MRRSSSSAGTKLSTAILGLLIRREGLRLAAVLLLFILFTPALCFAAASDKECLRCHEGKGKPASQASATAPQESLQKQLSGSVHRGVACADCHKDALPAPHAAKPEKVNCGSCHKESAAAFDRSVHGAAYKKGDKDAPSCSSCHGTHAIYPVSNLKSPANRQNQVLLCVKCHTDAELQKKHGLPSADMIKAYDKSVHGTLVKEGRGARAAVCSDCHGAHLVLGPRDRESTTNKLNISSVCGRCHVQVYNEYKVSIHGKDLAAGKLENPSCTDCHGEHTLTLVKDPESKVYAKNVPATCARCHENQEIIAKYRLPSDRYSSYVGSFHGVAMKYGQMTAANCTSCHETHRILPEKDPESSISERNLPRTCGRCHPNIKNVSSLGKVHVEARRESSPGMYYVRQFYTWFIGILMVLFVGYIVLDVYGRVRRKKSHE
jgi:hypothetical protein